MKRKTRRRLLAGLLAVLMVVGIMPFDLFGNMVKVDAAGTTVHILNANDLEIATIDTTIKVDNYFDIVGSADKSMSVDNNSESVTKPTDDDSLSFTKRMKTVGATDNSGRYISFSTSGSATVSVYMVSGSSKDATRKMQLKKDSSVVDELTAVTSTSSMVKQTFTITEAGDYQLWATAAINIYYIKVEESGSTPTVNEETYTMEVGNAENVCKLYDSSDLETPVTSLAENKTGKWINSTIIKTVDITTGTGKIRENGKNFQVNSGIKFTFPVINNATSCTITWKNYTGYEITTVAKNDGDEFTVTDVNGSESSVTFSQDEIVDNKVSLTIKNSGYLYWLKVYSTDEVATEKTIKANITNHNTGEAVATFTASKAADSDTISNVKFTNASGKTLLNIGVTEIPTNSTFDISAATGNEVAGDFSIKIEDSNVKIYHSAISSGTTAIASIPYALKGSLAKLNPGSEITESFSSSFFGETNLSADTTEELFSNGNYMSAMYTASGNTLSMKEKHGVQFKGKVTISAIVPAGTAGEFTIPICYYNRKENDTVSFYVDEVKKFEESAFGNIGAENCDAIKKVYTYINDSAEDKIIKAEITGLNGTTYLHYAKYAVRSVQTITGHVAPASGVTVPAGTSVVFTDPNGNEFKAALDASNNYSVVLPASEAGIKYNITYSDNAYSPAEEEKEFTVKSTMTDPEKVKNLGMYKYELYQLSGSITGLDSATLNQSDFKLTFTTSENSTYRIPDVVIDKANATYSIKLEKDVKYNITASGTGIGEYELNTKEAKFGDSDLTDNAKSMEISFSAKPKYSVKLAFSAGPDLSDPSLIYKFTSKTNSAYKYEFTDIDAIKLKSDSYHLEIIGQAYHTQGYSIIEGYTVNVLDAELTHAVTFDKATLWKFNGTYSTDGDYYTGFYQNGQIAYYNGLKLDTTTGKIAARLGNGDTQFNNGSKIVIPVTGNCTIKASASQAAYGQYINVNGVQGIAGEQVVTSNYVGGAGEVTVSATANGYLGSISVEYPATDNVTSTQTEMPYVPNDDTDANTAVDTDGIPRGNVKNNIIIGNEGQKLNFSQSNGNYNEKYELTGGLSYYVFPMTDKLNTLEFDVKVTNGAGKNNWQGFYAGIFTNNYVYSLALRKGGTNIRGLKSSDINGGKFAGATDPAETTIALNTLVHYSISRTEDKVTVTMTYKDGLETITKTFSSSTVEESENKVYYGMCFADVNATITNMIYKAEDGTVLYNQNSAYSPKGTAPTPQASSLTQTAESVSTDIKLNWFGEVPQFDGTYALEVSINGGDWELVDDDIKGFTYEYPVQPATTRTYKFRVAGQLGKKDLGGTRTEYVETSDVITVTGALEVPKVTINASDSDITLSWDAVEGATSYIIQRYSADEGISNVNTNYKTVTGTTFTDTAVDADVPYYYMVMSKSEGNASAVSAPVWAVVATKAAHTGEYVYESEAIEYFITKKSYDTVFTDKAVIEGIVYEDCTAIVNVNGTKQDEESVKAKDKFTFNVTLVPGRNDVDVLLKAASGKVTRMTYNFVYLTNYDIVVDAAFEGTDGTADTNGIPQYKTVTAAVNSISSGNGSNKVIFVKSGSYEERLVVDKPYVSIIGEDRENTSIHFYPGVLGEKYEAGGDMDKRCATYITSAANNFSAENITFANDYDYSTPDKKSNKSADAIRVESDQAVFTNVKFVSVQDTLYIHQGHSYFNKCRIEGLVDFIYSGDDARAYFNDCDIKFVYQSTKNSGYVCAPKTATDATYGLTFNNCRVTGEEGVAGTGYLLARPWGADAYVTWINCYLGKCVYKVLPYGNMNGTYSDARFFEFGSYGPGYAINSDRRQISPTQAQKFTSNEFLGWEPDVVSENINEMHYIGTVVTVSEEKFDEKIPNDDKYLQADGDDKDLAKYAMEGYASAYGVTGGGLLKENNDNYYAVNSAKEFLDALLAVKASGKNSVIELKADINLGSKEIDNYESYNSVIKAYTAQPLTHPTLLKSGASTLTMTGFNNLTIFSSNASSIKHCNITLKSSENIIFRNIKFDELWEWDENTKGAYDRNDWDYMTIDSTTNGVWIDHCTFFKAYDGIVDIKNPNPETNVTVSWCEFLPGSEDNIFFNEMMDELEKNPDSYPYYKSLADSGMTKEQIWWYAYGQKKTHLLGQSATATNAEGIRATFANNYYKDQMDRLPRLRYGNSHVYNCVMDAQELLDIRLEISNSSAASHIVSNGASSNIGAEVLLENCLISGIQKALISGNGEDTPGYINAINSKYYMNGVEAELQPICNSSVSGEVLVTNDVEFKKALPYSDYILYKADELGYTVVPYAGAGKLNLTNLQWEKVKYNDEYVAPTVVVEEQLKNVIKDTLPDSVLTDEVKNKTGCDTVEELIEYLKKVIITNSKNKGTLKDIKPENTKVVDVEIMISKDNGVTWLKATKENFPKEGVDVVIPYPEGTSKEGFEFEIGHLIVDGINGGVPGTMEFYKPDKTDDGLKIHVTSCSPFVIGWMSQAEIDAVKDEEPEEPEEQLPDKSDDSSNTGDSNRVLPYILIMGLTTGVMFMAWLYLLTEKNKKKN